MESKRVMASLISLPSLRPQPANTTANFFMIELMLKFEAKVRKNHQNLGKREQFFVKMPLQLCGKCFFLIDSAELKQLFIIFAGTKSIQMIIGRNKEKEKIIRAYQSEYSQFVTVYGRRRVGKTFFVRETFGCKFTFEHAGLAHTDMKGQLASWKSSLQEEKCCISTD